MNLIAVPKDWRRVVVRKPDTWLVFADWLEDRGEQQRAEGWRLLDKEKRFPLRWSWNKNKWFWRMYGHEDTYGNELPSHWFNMLKGETHIIYLNLSIRLYTSRFEALDDAACNHPPGELMFLYPCTT